MTKAWYLVPLKPTLAAITSPGQMKKAAVEIVSAREREAKARFPPESTRQSYAQGAYIASQDIDSPFVTSQANARARECTRGPIP